MVVTHAMELERSPKSGLVMLSKDIAYNQIQPHFSFADIAHLKQVCSDSNALYDAERLCPSMGQTHYSTYACSRLFNNYYACTQALVHFAHKNDEKRFQYLWQYHQCVRDANVATILKSPSCTLQDQMAVYKKYYGEKKKIYKHIINDGVHWLSEQNVLNALMIFSCGNLMIYDLLLNAGYDEESPACVYHVCRTFNYACKSYDSEVMRILIGDHVDARLFEHIMECVPVDLLIDLICAGIVPIRSADQFGKSLLHYAAEAGFASLITVVLNMGACVNCIDALQMTPMHYATKNLRVNAVKALLAAPNVNLSFVNKHGNTALHYVRRGLVDVPKERKEIRLLLKSYRKEHYSGENYNIKSCNSKGYQQLQ